VAERWTSRLEQPRTAAWLLALLIVGLYFLRIGASGAWDPWETHYGEVARQMVMRSDPLDLWWQPGLHGPDARAETYFASKPALPFWVWAISFEVFRVGMNADPAEMLDSPWPELALRVPVMLAGFLAIYVLAYTLWRRVSPRAGLLTAVILATMPQWALVSRQALTDIFFVTPVVVAAVAWTNAWGAPDRPLRLRGRGWQTIPWDRAYATFWLVFGLGAIVPLAVIHHHSYDATTWAMFGKSASKAKGLLEIQRHMFLYWAVVVAVALRSTRWRLRSQAWMGILYICAGVSLMGKGMIGPGLVGVFVLADLALSGAWSRLRSCGLVTGIATFVLACFPWHHAMALYRGDVWVNELIIQNNLQRFSTGEQEQAVGGVAFYLETLGLAALPWSALVPFAWVHGRAAFRAVDGPAAATHRFMVAWFGASLFVVTYSTTKYYHYLVPCLPPLAAMLGITLDDLWARRGKGASWLTVVVAFAILAGTIRDLVWTPTWIAHLTTYLYTGMWTQGAPSTARVLLVCAPFVVGLVLFLRRKAAHGVLAWCLSGVLTTGYVLADYLPAASETWSQRSAFATYFAERGPRDRLVGWWFYYRGETFFAKGDLWVIKGPERERLAELFEEHEGRDMALWFITIEAHAQRLRGQLPARYRDRLEERYRNFHYVLMRVPLGSTDVVPEGSAGRSD